MKEYKKKRHSEWWSLDKRPTGIKKQLNSSERWRAKRIIKEQVDDLETLEDFIDNERWNEESKWDFQGRCLDCEMDDMILDRLGIVFLKLGIVVITDYDRNYYECEHQEPGGFGTVAKGIRKQYGIG